MDKVLGGNPNRVAREWRGEEVIRRAKKGGNKEDEWRWATRPIADLSDWGSKAEQKGESVSECKIPSEVF